MTDKPPDLWGEGFVEVETDGDFLSEDDYLKLKKRRRMARLGVGDEHPLEEEEQIFAEEEGQNESQGPEEPLDEVPEAIDGRP